MSIQEKRPRSTNFSYDEAVCLVDEIIKRAKIIENKKSDAVTWKEKEEAWLDVTKSFNSLNFTNRTTKMLKVKYDGIKRQIKLKDNKAKAKSLKTGGGAVVVEKYTPFEEKLVSIISTSAIQKPEESISVPSEPMQEPARTKSKWQSWNAMRKSPINQKLGTSKKETPVQNKYLEMTKSREDLIDIQTEVARRELEKNELQIEMLKKEETRRQKEFELRMEFLKKEHVKKMELLEKELQNVKK